MSGAKLFLSTDGNAPVVSGGDNTCLVNLLKACLIDGYGDTAPVGGWTMPYTNAEGSAAVFKNDFEHGALGHCLRVAHNSLFTWNTKCYEDMTTVDEGSFPWRNSSWSIKASDTTNNVARAWLLLATKTWMFFLVFFNSTNTSVPDVSARRGNSGFWFGDIEPWNPSDNYHTMYSNVGGNMFGTTTNSSATASSAAYVFPRSSAGVVGPVYGGGLVPHPQIGIGFGTNGPEYTPNSGLLTAKVAFMDSGQYSLRGWLPDALVPLHRRPFSQLERVTINNTTYIAVTFWTAQSSTSDDSYSQLLFRLEDEQ